MYFLKKKRKNMLTQKRLKQLYSYDPSTGLWTWNKENHFRRNFNKNPGHRRTDGYLYIFVEGKMYLSHRLSFLYMKGKLPPSGMEVDHINCNRDDDRFANLRIVSKTLNRQNRKQAPRSDNTSGYLGVFKGRSGWVASLHLGTFETPKLAHDAYMAAKRQVFPERSY